MKSTSRAFVLILFFGFMLVSCASPYIGRSVKTEHPAVCNIGSLPVECSFDSGQFDITYEISETENLGEYKITGTASKNGGTSKTFTEFSSARFILLLVDDDVVVETLSIAAGRGSFDRPLTFSRTFKTENEFQATLITYEMRVRG